MKPGFIGPIPSVLREADPYNMPFYHPGGPAPAWGGYRPVKPGMDWLSFCVSARAGDFVHAYSDDWQAHTSDTRLVFAPEGWYVERPDRFSQRAVQIACSALRTRQGEFPGERFPTLKIGVYPVDNGTAVKAFSALDRVPILLAIGIRQDEVDAAIHEVTQVTDQMRAHRADHACPGRHPGGAMHPSRYDHRRSDYVSEDCADPPCPPVSPPSETAAEVVRKPSRV